MKTKLLTLRILTVFMVVLILIEVLYLSKTFVLDAILNGFLMIVIGVLSLVLAYLNYKKKDW
ncbi:hypothetical protein [Zunongwangia atlantica]|uniref:Uncharacterized protein n=1 Tax=Zunongwangia atlantica 22II14-10F7 TaxID=1185767 RepID=A0A1Y1T5E8_9FLAO|nr:hypothetical protein [Zunongwangia atlantica]ORL46256.1 hypothetical protein IIF7_06791 [Zunongwangia atlantica 22II14-10F7]